MNKTILYIVATIAAIFSTEASAKSSADSLKERILLGQKYLFEDKYDSAYTLLNGAMLQWEKYLESDRSSISDSLPLSTMFNGLGVYKILCDKDYKSSIEFFVKALESASETGKWRAYSEITYNLVYTLFIRGESSGLQYSLDLYNKGEEMQDERQIYLGANCAALMYYRKGDRDKAEEYLDRVFRSPYLDSIKTSAYNLQAIILEEKGDFAAAGSYYDKAMKDIDSYSASAATYLCLSYGKYLTASGRPDDAEKIIIKGLDISGSRHNMVFEHDLYLALSDAYIAQGNLGKGLEAYKKYHSLEKDFFNLEHDREVVKMMVQFDTEKHKAELQRKNLDLAHRRNQLRVLSIAVCVILAMLIIIAVMYRHKSKMYLSIAKKYKEDAERKAQATMHPGKSEELFERLEALMNEKKIYRNSMISRDDIADMLGTNRTYLTTVISERTKKNFNQYINSFRMSEALSLLSDAEKEVVLKDLAPKVGFNSISTFYKLFKEEIGMTPAKFREQILYLGKKKEE